MAILSSKEVIAVKTDWRILRETEDWVVVDKPAPLIVHPTSAKKEPTLVTLMEAYYLERGEEVALSLINRLDRETSGCVLVAKNSGAARVFGRAMMRREIEKSYLAIVRGWPKWEGGCFREEGAIIRRGEVEALEGDFVWVQQMVHESGKASVTNFELVEKFERRFKSEVAGGEETSGRYSLIRCVTETGRMHQIRVHLEHVGYPMVGDKIYGGDSQCYLDFVESGWTKELSERLLLERQALHGESLAFEWEEEKVEVCCGLSDDLVDFTRS